VVALFRTAPLDDHAALPDDTTGALFHLAPPDGHALEVLPFFRLHLSSTPHQFYPPSFFLITLFSCSIFQLPSFTYFELFPFMKYTAMAPPIRTNNYYELGDRTLVLGANLKEHKVEAIHQGLLEAFAKMTKCQLQLF
jgi:hypothetical protein